MTSINAARKAIYDHYANTQSDFTPGSTLTFENLPFTEPATAWARMSVIHTGAPQETLGATGARKFKRTGNAIINIFVPFQTGTLSADTYANNAREIFEGTRITGTTIYFTDVNIREGGVEDNWYSIVVDASFVYYSEK